MNRTYLLSFLKPTTQLTLDCVSNLVRDALGRITKVSHCAAMPFSPAFTIVINQPEAMFLKIKLSDINLILLAS